MTRDEAIAWIKEIQNGSGVDRDGLCELVPMGSVAFRLRNDATFAYGIEYGILFALMTAFGLREEDLS